MVISIEGRGEFTLSLIQGDRLVSQEGQVVMQTIGNPSKLLNPKFNTLEEAESYFQTLPLALPIVTTTAEEGA